MDLGVTVNNKLLCKEQCDKLVSKGNLQLGMLMRTCHFAMNKKQKITFYLTIVRSIIAPLYGDLKVPTKLLLLMQYRKELFYLTIVRSIFEHCSIIWGL